MDQAKIADEAIGLFLEYRDQYGYDEEEARARAVCDIAEAPTDEEWAAMERERDAEVARLAALPPVAVDPDIPF